MIYVEGYKAFHGAMKITPKDANLTPIEKFGDWLFKPDTKCWYSGDASYPAEICTVESDEILHS